MSTPSCAWSARHWKIGSVMLMNKIERTDAHTKWPLVYRRYFQMPGRAQQATMPLHIYGPTRNWWSEAVQWLWSNNVPNNLGAWPKFPEGLLNILLHIYWPRQFYGTWAGANLSSSCGVTVYTINWGARLENTRKGSTGKWPCRCISMGQERSTMLNSLRPSDAYICAGKLTVIGSDNGLWPEWRQAIIWTTAGILLIGPLGTNLSENLIRIQTFSFSKMHLKISSAKWRAFCLGLMC